VRPSNQPPPSALKTVGALGRELSRLSLQLEQTAKEIERTKEPSRLIALEKLNQQRSTNFARLSKQAIAAERELGLLLEKSDVDQTLSRMLIEFRRALEQMPRRVATHPLFHEIDPVKISSLLQAEVDETLNFLLNIVQDEEPR
jgi:hypothetical protein